MKNILIITILATLGLTNIHAEASNAEMCKTYIKEAKGFASTMQTNKVSESTLAFYKDKVVSHCGNIASKTAYEKDFFAHELMKKDTTTVSNCKLAINMAKAYDDSANTSAFIANAHKVNVIDNCGTVAAKKAPAFCLFDKIDNSKDTLKDKCIASIEKAHATIGTSTAFENKAAVLVNCGRLAS